MTHTVHQFGNTIVFRFTAPFLRTDELRAFKNATDHLSGDANVVVMNLERVTAADNSALGFLADRARRFRLNGGSLRACCLNDGIKFTFALAGLHSIKIYKTEKETLGLGDREVYGDQMTQELSDHCQDLERQVANLRSEIEDLKKDQWRMEAAMRQLQSRVLEREPE